MQLRMVDEGNAALKRELVRLLARTDAAYLQRHPGLPCCPSCAGIARCDDDTLKDVAHAFRDGQANAPSLAAWHLAEAWGDGIDAADVVVTETANGLTYTVNVPGREDDTIEIDEAYALPVGSFCGCKK